MKLRIHVYICRVCGMGRVNAQTFAGDWYTTFHCPDGTSIVARYTPECETGRTTEKRLARYADQIRAATEHAREGATA